MLSPVASRKARTEAARKGLVILEAAYGIIPEYRRVPFGALGGLLRRKGMGYRLHQNLGLKAANSIILQNRLLHGNMFCIAKAQVI